MQKKIIKFCALLLVGMFGWLSGDWFVSQGRIFSIMMHCLFTMVLFYCLPVVIFKQNGYRLVSFVSEIILGFMLFLWFYLNGPAETKVLSDIAWAELLMFDGACILATGFGGALCYASSTRNE